MVSRQVIGGELSSGYVVFLQRGAGLRMEGNPDGVWSNVWGEEEEKDFRRCRVAVVTSR